MPQQGKEMGELIDIRELLKDRKWNEDISEFLETCDGTPEEILMCLEEYLRIA